MFNRRDAETPRKKFQNPIWNNWANQRAKIQFAVVFSLRLCVSAVILFFLSCGSKPADLRTFIPADSLVYLESNDLGAVMTSITERPAFREAAKTVPDYSVLNGVKMAVAVTGFESKEIPVTHENAVLSFQPRFVAILETNAWNFQALRFTENKLGEFINQVYGGDVVLETSDKNDGKYFVWTAKDGRKAFALVQGSVVFFGNDETAIEKSLAVKRGEAHSIAKNPKITDADRLAFGYVSNEGAAQIANIAGFSTAKLTSEVVEVQGFVARVLPEILRNFLREVTWTATKSNEGIADSFSISLNSELAAVLNETLVPGPKHDDQLSTESFNDALTVTRYNLRDPQLAWRSILLSAGKATDPVSGKLLVAFANSLFEPYGIEDGEKFLSSVGPEILTARFDAEGEEVFVLTRAKDATTLQQSIAEELRGVTPKKDPNNGDLSIQQSADGELMLTAASSGIMKLGDAKSVLRTSDATNSGHAKVFESDAVSATYGRSSSASDLIQVLTGSKDERQVNSSYFTETRFNRNGIERRTVSDSGLIGWIITQFAADE